MFFIADHSWLQLVKSVLICCVCLRCLRVASYKAITQESVAVWAPLLGVEFWVADRAVSNGLHCRVVYCALPRRFKLLDCFQVSCTDLESQSSCTKEVPGQPQALRSGKRTSKIPGKPKRSSHVHQSWLDKRSCTWGPSQMNSFTREKDSQVRLPDFRNIQVRTNNVRKNAMNHPLKDRNLGAKCST